ncbi:MAG TPA: hypothetical protein VFN57_16195 [Thermomicrobiaceae bacterium]|nr:hypothetical protein [Thermomicrobiaceae bacterium]
MSSNAGEPDPERWEPPRLASATRAAESSPEQSGQSGRDVWATAALASVGRVGVAVLLVAAGLPVLPATISAAVGIVAELALFVTAAIAWREGLPAWGVIWTVDVLGLGLVVPLAVSNGFPASGTGPMSPAASSAYAETWFGVAVALALVAVTAWYLSRRVSGFVGLTVLPASLAVPAVLSSLGNYGDAAILRALAVAFAVSALATLVAWPLRASLRRLVAPSAWLVFVLGVLVPAHAAAALGTHGAGVGIGYLVLLLASALMVVLDPSAVRQRSGRETPRRRRNGSAVSGGVSETTEDLPDLYAD